VKTSEEVGACGGEGVAEMVGRVNAKIEWLGPRSVSQTAGADPKFVLVVFIACSNGVVVNVVGVVIGAGGAFEEVEAELSGGGGGAVIDKVVSKGRIEGSSTDREEDFPFILRIELFLLMRFRSWRGDCS
jgi:hypothetical protein